MAFKPWFSHYHVPTGKLGYVKGEIFHMLVDLQPQGTSMSDVPNLGANSIS
jgi:hypothetical protein